MSEENEKRIKKLDPLSRFFIEMAGLFFSHISETIQSAGADVDKRGNLSARDIATPLDRKPTRKRR